MGLGEFPACAPQTLSMLPPVASQPGWVTISRARIFPIQPGLGEGSSGTWIASWGGEGSSDFWKDAKVWQKELPWSLS